MTKSHEYDVFDLVAQFLQPWGQAVTFTASVRVLYSGTATGTATIKDSSTTLRTVALSLGKASITISNLAAGSHSIGATTTAAEIARAARPI